MFAQFLFLFYFLFVYFLFDITFYCFQTSDKILHLLQKSWLEKKVFDSRLMKLIFNSLRDAQQNKKPVCKDPDTYRPPLKSSGHSRGSGRSGHSGIRGSGGSSSRLGHRGGVSSHRGSTNSGSNGSQHRPFASQPLPFHANGPPVGYPHPHSHSGHSHGHGAPAHGVYPPRQGHGAHHGQVAPYGAPPYGQQQMYGHGPPMGQAGGYRAGPQGMMVPPGGIGAGVPPPGHNGQGNMSSTGAGAAGKGDGMSGGRSGSSGSGGSGNKTQWEIECAKAMIDPVVYYDNMSRLFYELNLFIENPQTCNGGIHVKTAGIEGNYAVKDEFVKKFNELKHRFNVQGFDITREFQVFLSGLKSDQMLSKTIVSCLSYPCTKVEKQYRIVFLFF